jgi:hypothetical protein
MASLVEQIMAQSQMGSANGAGFGDSFFKGMELGQRQQQVNMQRRQVDQELAQEAALFPLKETLMRQNAQMGALNIEEALEGRQNRITNDSQLLILNKNVARSFTEADGPETAQQMLFESLTKNPRLISDPRFQELRKMVDTSLQAKERLIELRRSFQGQAITPEVKQLPVGNTGKTVDVVRLGPNSYQMLPKDEDKSKEVADKQGIATLQKQIDILAKQRLELDRTEKDYHSKRLELLGEESELQRKINRITGKSASPGAPALTAPAATAPAPPKKLRWTPSGLVPFSE